jgi:hypothetical protein
MCPCVLRAMGEVEQGHHGRWRWYVPPIKWIVLMASEPIEQVGDLPRSSHALLRSPYRFLLLRCRVQRIYHLQPQLRFIRMYIHSSIACQYARHAVHCRGT